MNTSQTAILFLTHIWNPVVARRFARLRAEAEGQGDFYLLIQSDAVASQTDLPHPIITFHPPALSTHLGLPYIRTGIVPGCAHYPIVAFALEHSYTFLWVIEHDVEYRGRWEDFFLPTEASDADLLASHVLDYEDCPPNWFWWQPSSDPQGAPLDPRQGMKAFFPLYRISRRAILEVYAQQQRGYRGHFEHLIPTLLRKAGMSILDLHRFGACYRPGDQNPEFYPRSSLRWRPDVTPEEVFRDKRPGTIYHPIKQSWIMDAEGVTLFRGSSQERFEYKDYLDI